jgi:hypothetical protein
MMLQTSRKPKHLILFVRVYSTVEHFVKRIVLMQKLQNGRIISLSDVANIYARVV